MKSTGQKPLYPNMNFGAQSCCFICLTNVMPSAGEISTTTPVDFSLLELQDDRGEVLAALRANFS